MPSAGLSDTLPAEVSGSALWERRAVFHRRHASMRQAHSVRGDWGRGAVARHYPCRTGLDAHERHAVADGGLSGVGAALGEEQE